MRTETVARAPFLAELERAKGIGIFLVVVGHLVAVASLGPDWYAILKWLIYQFHMPFFMYLSGFAFAWTRPFQLGTDYATYLKRRAQRLLIPFFLFGVFIVCAKYFSGFFVYVDDYPESLLTGLSRLLFHTEDSPALSIWYIFVLFVFSVASFPLGQLDRAKLLVLLAVAVVIHFVYVPDFL